MSNIFLQLIQFCYPMKGIPWLFSDGLNGKEQWLLAPMEGSVLVKNQKRATLASKAEAAKRRRVSSGSAAEAEQTLEESLDTVMEEDGVAAAEEVDEAAGGVCGGQGQGQGNSQGEGQG